MPAPAVVSAQAYVVGFHAAWPQIKMKEHKKARWRKSQQPSASGALLGELQFSVSARPASGGCRLGSGALAIDAMTIFSEG
jgi:hypothetical protein